MTRSLGIICPPNYYPEREDPERFRALLGGAHLSVMPTDRPCLLLHFGLQDRGYLAAVVQSASGHWWLMGAANTALERFPTNLVMGDKDLRGLPAREVFPKVAQLLLGTAGLGDVSADLKVVELTGTLDNFRSEMEKIAMSDERWYMGVEQPLDPRQGE